MMPRPNRDQAQGAVDRWLGRGLDTIERAGNRLTDPITVFAGFIFLVLLASWAASRIGVGATHPGTGEEIAVVNLLTPEMIQRILVEMPRTFTDLPPLGLVLVVMIGIGVAERTGLPLGPGSPMEYLVP